jgi:chromosome segregation ATPase
VRDSKVTQNLQAQLDVQVKARVQLQADLELSAAQVQALRVKLNDAENGVKQREARVQEMEGKLCIQDKEALRALLQKEELQREVQSLKDTVKSLKSEKE